MAAESTYSRDIVSQYYGLDDFHETFTVWDTNCRF